MATQNQHEYVRDQRERGLMTAEEANIYLIRCERVRLITSKVPAFLRKELNAAVKSGQLKHVKKDGNKPEAYYHPEFEHLMKIKRSEYANKQLNRLIDAYKSIVARD